MDVNEYIDKPNPALAEASAQAWSETHKRITIERRKVAVQGPYYPVEVTLKSEPRIQYIQRLLQSLLGLGSFTRKGEVVKVDGFMLKELSNWTDREPVTSEEIFNLLSERCAVKCEFCYLRMDPEGAVTKFNPNSSEAIKRDIDLRIELARQGRRLFSPTFQLEEVIGNSHFREVARSLRAISDEVFYLSTTGSALDESMLDFLQAVEPVEVRVSLNSVDPADRVRIMGDKKNVILQALKSLHARNMRFSVSLVVWPNLSWEEIEATVLFADACQPYALIAILPGYTEQFSKSQLFDTETYWAEATRRLSALRFSMVTPLLVHPRLYEENTLGYPPNTALIIGMTAGSAAARSELRIGDVIIGVDQFNPIYSRRQVDSLLLIKHQQNPDIVTLHVRRGAEELSVELDVRASYANGYPYTSQYTDRFGIVIISQGVSVSDLRELERIAQRAGARTVGVATSSIVLPSLTHLLETWRDHLFTGIDVVPFIPENRFYGGNILLGELCTASDYLTGINKVIESRPEIDLVVIPSPAFGSGGWWRDLEGVSFTWLQRNSPVPVHMLVCDAFE